MVMTMQKHELEAFIDVGVSALSIIRRRETDARREQLRKDRKQHELELDAHEAEMRRTLRPGDVVQLSYDQERDKAPRNMHAVVVKVNRINVKLLPCGPAMSSGKRLANTYRVWTRHHEAVIYHRPRYVTKLENATVLD
ncbi:MAG: hypothetical protein CMA72_04425 [Euryarchaeota archaeon]|nr:hypothetical protein [Euryarchaeota archaeon]